jgi:hypothetical protein
MNLRKLSGLLLCAGMLLPRVSSAQTIEADPERKAPIDTAASNTGIRVVDSLVGDIKTPLKPKPLSWKAVAIPVGMIAYGALTLESKRLQQVNLYTRREVMEHRNFATDSRRRQTFDDIGTIAPAVAVYGLNIVGVKGKNNLVDRSIIFGMSNLISNGLVFSTKKLAGVTRPDSSDHYSFPSGHTAQAFVSAEFLRQEYKDVSPWIGVAGYAVAVTTGALRMYNNKHWFNDVVAGAGVGILSTRLSYWLYPKLKNVILRKATRPGVGTIITPTYQNGAFGVGMVHNF